MICHTPGPWEIVDPSENFFSTRIFSGSHYIAAVSNSDDTPEQRMHDARLIAASPELLGALMEASAILDRLVSEIGIDPAVEPDTPAYRARQAIAKATGGEI